MDVKVTMYREIPLEYRESPQGIATEIAFAKRKAIRVDRRRTERPYTHASIGASTGHSSRGVVDGFPAGILSPVEIEWNSREHIRSHVWRGAV